MKAQLLLKVVDMRAAQLLHDSKEKRKSIQKVKLNVSQKDLKDAKSQAGRLTEG